MSGKKLTVKEIIKALECCVSANYICPHTCPMLKNKECLTSLRKNALDLINRLQAENEKLKIENSSLSKEIIDTKIEMYKQCIEEMREKIVNTPVDVNLTGETNEYRAGYLDGRVAKQHDILDILDNLLKELEEK